MPDASFPPRFLVADIHLTNAECREAGGDKKAAASELAIARRSITGLTPELSSDSAVAELTRRADAQFKTLRNSSGVMKREWKRLPYRWSEKHAFWSIRVTC